MSWISRICLWIPSSRVFEVSFYLNLSLFYLIPCIDYQCILIYLPLTIFLSDFFFPYPLYFSLVYVTILLTTTLLSFT